MAKRKKSLCFIRMDIIRFVKILNFFEKYFVVFKIISTFAIPSGKGEVVEWSITAVLKTVELRGSGGSNPSLSAKEKENQRRVCSSADFLFLLQRPAAGGEGKGMLSVANPSPPSPARFKRRVWKSYRVSPNFRPTASEIIRKVESCMSVSPFSRRATYSLFLPILSASCC